MTFYEKENCNKSSNKIMWNFKQIFNEREKIFFGWSGTPCPMPTYAFAK